MPWPATLLLGMVEQGCRCSTVRPDGAPALPLLADRRLRDRKSPSNRNPPEVGDSPVHEGWAHVGDEDSSTFLATCPMCDENLGRRRRVWVLPGVYWYWMLLASTISFPVLCSVRQQIPVYASVCGARVVRMWQSPVCVYCACLPVILFVVHVQDVLRALHSHFTVAVEIFTGFLREGGLQILIFKRFLREGRLQILIFTHFPREGGGLRILSFTLFQCEGPLSLFVECTELVGPLARLPPGRYTPLFQSGVLPVQRYR